MGDVRRIDGGRGEQAAVTLDELAREGARRMIAAALETEVDQYVGSSVDELGEDGRRLVVRNGHARERRVTVGSGTVPIRAPRVNEKRVDEARASVSGSARESCRGRQGARRRSTTCCRSCACAACRAGTFRPALEQLLGE